MKFREATSSDILPMQVVRNRVKENQLSSPSVVKDEDYIPYLDKRGKGWVCEIDGKIVGFAIADLKENNIWALFIDFDYEAKGIGKHLQKLMLDWYFNQTQQTVWLGTAPNTRAEGFYTRTGWTPAGLVNKGEVKFEMSYQNWKKRNT